MRHAALLFALLALPACGPRFDEGRDVRRTPVPRPRVVPEQAPAPPASPDPAPAPAPA